VPESAGSSIYYYYSASKAFVNSLVKTAAIESNAFCTVVNGVMVPGVVNTDIMPFDENTPDKQDGRQHAATLGSCWKTRRKR
jgi:NAD(P)-dependent dehydrogenase (short-subunit alcohol dehydrogenase family)